MAEGRIDKLGRGPRAVEDMKVRLAAMRDQSMSTDEIINSLWARAQKAVTGNGYDLISTD